MSADASPAQPANETHVLEFARAFRAAARAVGFYPPSHQNVVSALDQVMAAAAAATARGALCLTILPQGFLAGGVPIDTSETVVAELALLCHRHGVGALNLDGRATPDAWRDLFALLARRPEEVRAAGGIQRQWKALRHVSPAILEVDFGALLRGQVGGDFIELAAVISHYLETAGVGASILDDPCAALRRAIENAPDEGHAITAVIRELRAAAQLTRTTQPEQFDNVFRRAAGVAEYLTEGIMTGLIERRGTAEAMVGTLDVVMALVERMPDAAVSTFLAKGMGREDADSTRLAAVFTTLVPDAGRRRTIVQEAQDIAFEDNVVETWAEFERNLDAHVDRRFISDQYIDELHAARARAGPGSPDSADPPENLAAWTQSIGEEAVRERDLELLADLARIETDNARARKVFEILQAHVLGAVEDGDWNGAARTAEAIRAVAAESADDAHRVLANDALQKLAGSRASGEGLGRVTDADPALSADAARLLCAIGPPLVAAVAGRWTDEKDPQARSRLESVIVSGGRPGREALRRLFCSVEEPTKVRVAAIRLLRIAGGTEHLPALEAALSDPLDEVRAEAFRALADVQSDRASDVLAKGIARADPATQLNLLALVGTLGSSRAVPIVGRLFAQIDPGTAAVPVYLSMIESMKESAGDGARAALTTVFERTHWGAPYRAWRFRSAARSALRAIGGQKPDVRRDAPPAATSPADVTDPEGKAR